MYINVRGYGQGNQERQSSETGNIWNKKKKTQDGDKKNNLKTNTVCFGDHYMQTNTKPVPDFLKPRASTFRGPQTGV
jgi:hypothetical protein